LTQSNVNNFKEALHEAFIFPILEAIHLKKKKYDLEIEFVSFGMSFILELPIHL